MSYCTFSHNAAQIFQSYDCVDKKMLFYPRLNKKMLFYPRLDKKELLYPSPRSITILILNILSDRPEQKLRPRSAATQCGI